MSEEGVENVKLSRGFLPVRGVHKDDRAAIERLVKAWYVRHAEEQFRRRLELTVDGSVTRIVTFPHP